MMTVMGPLTVAE